MTWVDAAIVIVFLFFIVTAFNNGFIRETLGMASAVLGVVLAGLFYDDIADSMLSSIDNVTTANVVAFLVIFVGVSLHAARHLRPAVGRRVRRAQGVHHHRGAADADGDVPALRPEREDR
jgi:hypothetical protein